MFTSDEKKLIREEFWSKFKAYSNRLKLKENKPGKWIMNDTGIKQLKLKFHFDDTHAFAGLEIDTRNLDKRIDIYDKLEKLKTILEQAIPFPLEWNLEVHIADRKTVSRIIAIKENVSIYNRDSWPETCKFLYDVMNPLEQVFAEYKDFLKYS